MRHKLLTRGPRRQRFLLAALIVSLGSAACRHEAARTVLVEADSTAVAPVEGLTQESTGSAPALEEVVIVEREVAPAPIGPPGPESDEASPENTPTPLDEKPPTVLETRERTLPAGTRIELVLKTPLHTATTLVGDRFAARVVDDVRQDGGVVVPEGALVEGRVDRVVSAERTTDEHPAATLHLRFDTLTLPSGDRLPLAADVAGSDTPLTELEPAEPGGSRVAGAARGALTGALLGRILGGTSRSTVLGTVIGGAAGAVIVAPAPDREVIVPSGTPIAIVLKEPIEIVRPPQDAAR